MRNIFKTKKNKNDKTTIQFLLNKINSLESRILQLESHYESPTANWLDSLERSEGIQEKRRGARYRLTPEGLRTEEELELKKRSEQYLKLPVRSVSLDWWKHVCPSMWSHESLWSSDYTETR